MIEWNIQSRAHACQACKQAFADKQPYFTLLFDQRHNLERLDVCAACWASQYSHGATERKGFVSFWQGVYTAAPPPPPEPIQKESAESLLRRLMELRDPEYATACFILAVMLERKRILRVKAQTTEESRRTLVYEHAKNGDLFTIADPRLQLDQLEEVQRQVAQLIEQGVDSLPMPVTTSPGLGQTGTAPTLTENPEDSSSTGSDSASCPTCPN